MARHAPFLSAMVLGSIGLLWPVLAMARPDRDPRSVSLLIARMAPSFERRASSSSRRLPLAMTLRNDLNATDRFDLANMKVRSVAQSVGPVELALTAGRAINLDQRYDMPYGVDHWTLKFIGATASLPLLSDVAFVIDGQYARMARRLSVLEVTPHRLATGIARLGGGLSFGQNAALMLDYVSVARSRRQDDLARMAEALGGAPATGHGPELSFTLGQGRDRGQSNWRLSLASMQRPMRDIGLAADGDIRNDARAMLSFTLHL